MVFIMNRDRGITPPGGNKNNEDYARGRVKRIRGHGRYGVRGNAGFSGKIAYHVDFHGRRFCNIY